MRPPLITSGGSNVHRVFYQLCRFIIAFSSIYLVDISSQSQLWGGPVREINAQLIEHEGFKTEVFGNNTEIDSDLRTLIFIPGFSVPAEYHLGPAAIFL